MRELWVDVPTPSTVFTNYPPHFLLSEMSAESYKLKGNESFKNQEYAGAVEEYTKAVLKDSRNPIYYTNRAMGYYKLGKYEETVEDCLNAIERGAKFKAYYYLGLAQTELGHLSKSETNLRKAYDMALNENSPSSPAICQAILNVRKKKWEFEEAKRMKSVGPLLVEVEEMYQEKREKELEEAEASLSDEELQDEKNYINRTYDEKLQTLKSIFSRADKKYEQREVPEHLLDPISFNLFVDPVITKSGNTFEKSWILQHLKTNATDPFSRVPLKKEDLIPNNQLRHAAEDFIKREGTF